ncbi:MAG: twitching motility protein PilT [Candidatus Fischerbacteria bacterium RBG_13_37_8]|uniref:Twitching motility protein PilT n=1 Tax=Candidatus Fischerbacteria bacterium RBG_13_37_8 TaxID=1817863 RepID=A0A1F5VDW0_9BACT|nr:MAG: twitching motility protein PilT [Candidatus Fischerbacteria bacterium RBG_13_37_8]
MNAILDTHIFLWWITDDPKLSIATREIIKDARNELFFSAASAWEISIKASLGRIQLPRKPGLFITEHLDKNSILALPILFSHALHVYNLPMHHTDPFDRMIIAQAQLENLTIITADPQFSAYNVKIKY